MISFVTLVNKEDVYLNNVLGSLYNQKAEFIPIFNPTSATKGLNAGIKKASNDIIVCCHQDVRFSDDWILKLFEQIKLLKDENWGVLGTYGIAMDGNHGAGNILSGRKKLYYGKLPCKVMSLDEHCLIIRKNSMLTFDEKLKHFHWYGADICLQAYEKGMSCYAIDAFVHHLSDNLERSKEFIAAQNWFTDKWKNRSIIKTYRTTCLEKGLIL